MKPYVGTFEITSYRCLVGGKKICAQRTPKSKVKAMAAFWKNVYLKNPYILASGEH
jgi:hypothetical protein